MKKIKQLSLLQTKEKLSQRKTISHLVDLKTEAEKCRKVSNELEEITKRKNNENQEITAYSFQQIDSSFKSSWSNVKYYLIGKSF